MILRDKLKAKAKGLFTNYNRNLLRELIDVNFKVNDHNSILGVFWSLLNPGITLMVMYFVFKQRFGHGQRIYSLYLLVGIVTVNFFITVTSYMVKGIAANRELILNSTVPREDVILADLFIHTYKFIIELVLCWLLSIFYGVFAWKTIPLALPLLIAYTGFVLGVSLIISLLYCFVRDIEYMWRITSRLFLFITPIFYTLHNISPFFSKIIYWANPVTPFLISFQQVFISNKSINFANYLYSLLLGCSFLIFGYYVFVIFENTAVERA